MTPPKKDCHEFRNRKSGLSINCMMVCGASGIIYSMNSSFPGCSHDSPILKSSKIYEKLQSGWQPFDPRKYGIPYKHSIILGDSAYPTKDPNLGTPYHEDQVDTEGKKNYNLCCCAARVCVEHGIGELKNRFPILKYGFLFLNMQKCSDIILILGAIHNFIKRNDNKNDTFDVSEKKKEATQHAQGHLEGVELAENDELATRDKIRMQFFD